MTNDPDLRYQELPYKFYDMFKCPLELLKRFSDTKDSCWVPSHSHTETRCICFSFLVAQTKLQKPNFFQIRPCHAITASVCISTVYCGR
jgi:hypothetical protein